VAGVEETVEAVTEPEEEPEAAGSSEEDLGSSTELQEEVQAGAEPESGGDLSAGDEAAEQAAEPDGGEGLQRVAERPDLTKEA